MRSQAEDLPDEWRSLAVASELAWDVLMAVWGAAPEAELFVVDLPQQL